MVKWVIKNGKKYWSEHKDITGNYSIFKNATIYDTITIARKNMRCPIKDIPTPVEIKEIK